MSRLYPTRGSHGSVLNRGRRGSDLYFQDYSMTTTMEEEKQSEKRLEELQKSYQRLPPGGRKLFCFFL